MICSASLIPYHSSIGYLLGEEYRWKEHEFMFHMVGGKVEKFDKDSVSTAVREFIEETNLLAIPYFEEIAFKNFELWCSQNTIQLGTKYPPYSSFIQKELEDAVRSHLTFYDEQVSQQGKIHRFYILDIFSMEHKRIRNILLQLPYDYSHFHPHMRMNDKMWSLHWVHISMLQFLPEKSYLLRRFIAILDKQIKKEKTVKYYQQLKKNKKLEKQNQLLLEESKKEIIVQSTKQENEREEHIQLNEHDLEEAIEEMAFIDCEEI
jgi:8-oxo-dGTP pyrophosphatase MutT (NUDIX family)